jgi:hypothetical protein
VPGGIAGRFIAIPDKALPIQRRIHIHIAIVYTRLADWLELPQIGISDEWDRFTVLCFGRCRFGNPQARPHRLQE